MKNLELTLMENLSGGELTSEEIDTFLGVGGCVLTLASGIGVIAFAFGAGSCARYLYN
jgi:hypothetical protein